MADINNLAQHPGPEMRKVEDAIRANIYIGLVEIAQLLFVYFLSDHIEMLVSSLIIAVLLFGLYKKSRVAATLLFISTIGTFFYKFIYYPGQWVGILVSFFASCFASQAIYYIYK